MITGYRELEKLLDLVKQRRIVRFCDLVDYLFESGSGEMYETLEENCGLLLAYFERDGT